MVKTSMKPKDTVNKALKPIEKPFIFYSDVGTPLGKSAADIKQFGEILKTIPAKSIEFHLYRQDFEKWLNYVGYNQLASDLSKIRVGGAEKGEQLREVLSKTLNKYI